jgi:methyltransferase-like protein
VLEVTEPASAMALAQLARNRSKALSLPALLEAIHEEASQRREKRSPIALDLRQLAQWVLDWYSTGAVELCTWAPTFVREPSARPLASLLARYESGRGWDVSTLAHRRWQLSDPLSRQVLQMLDGEHNREQIVQALLPHVQPTDASLLPGKKPREQRRELTEALRKQVDACLREFGRQALLMS